MALEMKLSFLSLLLRKVHLLSLATTVVCTVVPLPLTMDLVLLE